MKTTAAILFLLSFILFSSHTCGQVEQGNFLLGATSDLSVFFTNTTYDYTSGGTTNSEKQKSSQFNLSPSAAYFIIDGLAAGLLLDLGNSSQEEDQELDDGNTYTLKYNSFSYSLGPVLRYYFNLKSLKPFVHGQVSFGSNKHKYDHISYDFTDPLNPIYSVEQDERKYALSSYRFGAGMAFFITEYISIDALLVYKQNVNSYKDSDNDIELKNKINGFGLQLGFAIIIP